MAEYRRGAHTVFEIHLHLVWITKYRRQALRGEVATRARDLIRDICAQHEVKIMKGTRLEGPCAPIRVDTAASDDQPIATVAKREDGASSDGGIPAYQEAVLGATLVGARVFLL